MFTNYYTLLNFSDSFPFILIIFSVLELIKNFTKQLTTIFLGILLTDICKIIIYNASYYKKALKTEKLIIITFYFLIIAKCVGLFILNYICMAIDLNMIQIASNQLKTLTLSHLFLCVFRKISTTIHTLFLSKAFRIVNKANQSGSYLHLSGPILSQ